MIRVRSRKFLKTKIYTFVFKVTVVIPRSQINYIKVTLSRLEEENGRSKGEINVSWTSMKLHQWLI